MPHLLVDLRCACGNVRRARATRVRNGLVTQCASCARAAAAQRGGETRRSPFAAAHQVLDTYQQNARRKGLAFALTREQGRALLAGDCNYCGTVAAPFNGIDRIDNAIGYVDGNVASCCSICNYAKRDMTTAAFIDWIARAHAHLGLLQRDRRVRGAVAAQPDGGGAHHGGRSGHALDSRGAP